MPLFFYLFFEDFLIEFVAAFFRNLLVNKKRFDGAKKRRIAPLCGLFITQQWRTAVHYKKRKLTHNKNIKNW